MSVRRGQSQRGCRHCDVVECCWQRQAWQTESCAGAGSAPVRMWQEKKEALFGYGVQFPLTGAVLWPVC